MDLRDRVAGVSAWFVTKYRFTFLLLLAILVSGVAAYTTLLNREGFPAVDVPFVIVQTPYFVNDADNVNETVTEQYEKAFADVDDVLTISSTTTPNFSNVIVEFEGELSSTEAATRLKDAALAANIDSNLPTEFVTIDAGKVDGENDILFTISGDATPEELQKKAYEVAEKLEESAFIQEVNVIELIETETNPITGEQVEVQDSFTRVGVRDGELTLSFEDAISIGVVRKGAQDDVTFSKNLRSEVEVIQDEGILTDEFRVVYGGDFADTITDQIGSLESNALSGLIAVIVILFFFVSWRASIVTSIFIPLVLTGSFFGLYMFGYTLNVISLFALILVLGLFVDDAIVVVESIDAEKNKGEKGLAAVKKAIASVGLADISGTVTTVLVFAPMLFISGILGDFIKLIPITVILSLVLSLLIALTIIPFVSNIFIRKIKNDFIDSVIASIFFIVMLIGYFYVGEFEDPGTYSLWTVGIFSSVLIINSILSLLAFKNDKKIPSFVFAIKKGFWLTIKGPNKLVEKIAELTGKFYQFLFQTAISTVLSSVMLILISVGLIGFGLNAAGQLTFAVFAPSKDSQALSASVTFDNGTSLEDAVQISKELEGVIVRELGTEFESATYFGADNSSAIIDIGITPVNSRDTTAVEFAERMTEAALEIEGASIEIAVQAGGPPTDEFPFAMQITETDNIILEEAAKDIEEFLYELELTNGATVTEVKLADFSVISKKDGVELTEIRAKLSEENNTGLIQELQEKIEDKYDSEKLEELNLAEDALGFDFGQESENLESFESTIVAFIAALIFMYVLLVLQFNSFLQPILIFIAIPLSFPALFPGLLYTDNPLSFFTALGIIGLSGIVVNNSIMLIDFANQAREEGKSITESITEAVAQRFRPILTTSATTIAGLYPLAISDPFWESLAYALIFGVIASSILIIFTFPAYYVLIENIREAKNWVIRKLITD